MSLWCVVVVVENNSIALINQIAFDVSTDRFPILSGLARYFCFLRWVIIVITSIHDAMIDDVRAVSDSCCISPCAFKFKCNISDELSDDIIDDEYVGI